MCIALSGMFDLILTQCNGVLPKIYLDQTTLVGARLFDIDAISDCGAARAAVLPTADF
jgi:hypothetical protein